jgi:hypothetical protein
MMYSTTFRRQAVPSQQLEALADLIARAFLRLQSLGSALRMPAPTVPEASAQLLRLADTYDATQPSYAADLRAAAGRTGQD